MEKIIKTFSKYSEEMHKRILGRQFDKNGNEFYYQPERLNPEDAQGVCDSPNSEYKENPRSKQK